MPSKPKKRDYKKEYEQRKKNRPYEHERRMQRQKLRRKLDKDGVERKGKDIAHKKALSKGGSNKDGYTLQKPSKNRSFKRNKDKSMK